MSKDMMKKMRMVIEWEDDTVLIEGKKINRGTMESGIYILPLESDEKESKCKPEG